MRIATTICVVMLACACGDNLSEGQHGHMCTLIGESALDTTTWTFADIIPGTHQSDRVPVALRNCGNGTAVTLDATNADGTAKNPFVSIDWGWVDRLNDFPYPLKPNDTVSELKFTVVYKPEDCTGAECLPDNAATVRIEADDGQTRTLELAPPGCVPTGTVYPLKDTYFGSTPTSPETKLFQIENTSTCPLTVTKVAFDRVTSIFTLERDWADNTTIGGTTDADAQALTFSVRYQPLATGDLDSIVVEVTFAHALATPLQVSLDSSP